MVNVRTAVAVVNVRTAVTVEVKVQSKPSEQNDYMKSCICLNQLVEGLSKIDPQKMFSISLARAIRFLHLLLALEIGSRPNVVFAESKWIRCLVW